MGLDQYLYKIKKDISIKEYENKLKEIKNKYIHYTEEWSDAINEFQKDIGKEEIGYWRKFYDLNERCTELYYEDGGDGDFNCRYVELSYEDIDFLIDLFSYDEETVKILENALTQIDKGYKIWYSNWY